MKVIWTLVSILCLAKAQNDECQACKTNVKTLLDYMQERDQIFLTGQALITMVCLQLPDDQHEPCATGMYTWYPVLTDALFHADGFIDGICAGIGFCSVNSKLSMTCDDCENFINAIGTLFESEDFSYATTEDLKGWVYCENPDFIPAMQSDLCRDILDVVAIKGVRALGQILQSQSPQICVANGCTK